MAGNNDRIHGNNTLYRVNDAVHDNLQFQSFEVVMKGNRASVEKFVNRVVVQNPAAAQPVLDHQGHIVPQGIMNIVLDPLMIAISGACNSAGEVNAYIQDAAHHAQWLAPVVAYAASVQINPFDFDHAPGLPANALADAEARLGDLFSIITWNPVNICRAPEDERRANYPGNVLDAVVLARLNAHPAGVDPQWLAAVNALAAIAQPTPDNIRTYLAASTAALPAQQHAPTGYYSFPWVVQGGHLVPG